MMSPGLKEEILAQLDTLPSDLQRRVLELVRALARTAPLGVPGNQLLCFAGTIEEDDLKSMQQAIEEGCEKVDLNEW